MKNKDKPPIYKRILAYLLDTLAVFIISSIISYALPANSNYNNIINDLETITNSYREGAFQEQYSNLNYDLNKGSVDVSILVVTISILYYVFMYKLNDGRTLGKQILKLKLVSANDQKIGVNNYLIRCLIINNGLYNTIAIIMILFLSKSQYLLLDSKLSILFVIFQLVCVVFMIYRDDGRGIHDLITNTKVVNINQGKTIEEAVVSENELKGSDI